jgi:hypothetical protein
VFVYLRTNADVAEATQHLVVNFISAEFDRLDKGKKGEIDPEELALACGLGRSSLQVSGGDANEHCRSIFVLLPFGLRLPLTKIKFCVCGFEKRMDPSKGRVNGRSDKGMTPACE